jgi:hypothetical protein
VRTHLNREKSGDGSIYNRRFAVQTGLGKNTRPISRITRAKIARSVAQE